jgi:hypothetical protein
MQYEFHIVRVILCVVQVFQIVSFPFSKPGVDKVSQDEIVASLDPFQSSIMIIVHGCHLPNWAR